MLTNGPMHIFVDLDGVLVDLHAGILALPDFDHLTRDDLENNTNQIWNVIKAMLKNDTMFWEHLPWMLDGKELWDFVNKIAIEFDSFVSIISAPLDNRTSSKIGKIRWVIENLGQSVPITLCQYAKKPEYSGFGCYLIDDMSFIKEDWISKGGKFITHKSTVETKRILEQMVYGD